MTTASAAGSPAASTGPEPSPASASRSGDHVEQPAQVRQLELHPAQLLLCFDSTHRCEELAEDRLLITFCTGGLRSAGAANLLVEQGFEAVNMSRGLIDWRAAGGDLESPT
ncbi:hypothetical protein NSZ01_04670 [Nocardioides szechwanensis]|uniref:Rhodanese domain-containing protein n=1 Tax=Nocardioides szechwanensis TaxID=1005944 RepID=A0A1G9W9C3_9ACTN|nr:hypothetical protein [Nocardioides szechwanensis]GEP32699.1 hypothetical protein NSZ01_04670 [Nocardioides szechwanensis]SDM81122.1 hypothetical protein SAMN05192576_0988 [Nocardioides szechwanensis]